MDEKYIKNLGSSPHVNEGLWNQLKAKAAAVSQGAKNLSGGRLGSVGTTESAQFNVLFKSFVQQSISLIANFANSITPWINQHGDTLTPEQSAEIEKWWELEKLLYAIQLKNLPVTEANWLPSFGTLGAVAGGGVDKIMQAYRQKLAGIYSKFLKDVRALNIVPDQYITNKIMSSASGAKEALEAYGNVLGMNLVPKKSVPPPPAGTTTSPDAGASPAPSAAPEPTAEPVPTPEPTPDPTVSAEPAPEIPAPTPSPAPAEPEIPTPAAAPEVPTPAPTPAPIEPESPAPEPMPKLADIVPNAEPPPVTAPEAPAPVAAPTPAPTAAPEAPEAPKPAPAAKPKKIVKPAPVPYPTPAPEAPADSASPKLADLVPQSAKPAELPQKSAIIKKINADYIVPLGLLPLATDKQYKDFRDAIGPRDLKDVDSAWIKAAHAKAMGTGPKPNRVAQPPTGDNVVAPVKPEEPNAGNPPVAPDGAVPPVIPNNQGKPAKPPHLQKKAPEMVGPDSPEVVDYQLTKQALVKISKLLNGGKSLTGKAVETPAITSIKSELLDRNLNKAQVMFDADNPPIMHSFADGRIALLKLRYRFEKNGRKHCFDGTTTIYPPQQAGKPGPTVTEKAEEPPIQDPNVVDANAPDAGEEELSQGRGYHVILLYDSLDYGDGKGNLSKDFDVWKLVAKSNPELGATNEIARKSVDPTRKDETPEFHKKLSYEVGMGLRNLSINLMPDNIRGDRNLKVDPTKLNQQGQAVPPAEAEQNPKAKGAEVNLQPDQQGQNEKLPDPAKQKKAAKKPVKEGLNYRDFYRF